jgi:hypothetical protein
VALPFIPSDAGLLALQAATVAAPRAITRPGWMERFHGRGWALVPIGSIIVVVFAIRYVSDTATGLTWLALIAVPILAAVALGWAARGARLPLAVLAVPLFVLAWALKTSLVGEASAALLSALSCVTLGVLLPHWSRPARRPAYRSFRASCSGPSRWATATCSWRPCWGRCWPHGGAGSGRRHCSPW